MRDIAKQVGRGWVIESARSLTNEPVAIVNTYTVTAIRCLGVDGLQEGPVTYNDGCFHASRGVEVYTHDEAVGRIEVALVPPQPAAVWRDGEWWVEKRGKRVALGWELPAQKVG